MDEIGERVRTEPIVARAKSDTPLRRDYHSRKIAEISVACVRRAMLAESRAWTDSELALATNRPTTAVVAALNTLTTSGMVHADLALNHRQDIHGRTKVWLVRLTESDELQLAEWDRAIAAIERENEKLRNHIEWLEMCR